MGDPLFTDRSWQSADGLRLHYCDYAGDPDRVPVLCIPGLTRNARDFENVAARLAGSRRILCVDLRGRGGSDYADDPMSYVPAVYLQDLLALLAAERMERVVVFGTSLGGILAMLIGLAARGRLAGVLLNDVGPELAEEGLARIRSYVGHDVRFPEWGAAAAAIAANHADTFPDLTPADWLVWAHRMCREDDDAIRFDYDMRVAEPFRAPPAAALDLWSALDTLANMPALLVRGALSDILSIEVANAMAARLPLLDRVTIPRTGHAPTLEEPEAVAGIDRLLARVDQDWARNSPSASL